MEKKDIKQAVILTGGQGKRLRPFTNTNPKPMVLIHSRPFLEYLIEMLKEQGIGQIVLLTGYLGEKIKNYFNNGSKFGINIKYSFMPFLDDSGFEIESGTRIKNAENLLDDIFLLMYCDNYWPLNLKKLFEFYNKQKTLSLVTVYTNKDGSTKNNILVDNQGYVQKYDRTREDKELNGVEVGFFILSKKILDLMPKGKNFCFEKETLPLVISQKQLSGFLTDHKYYSISDNERLKITENFLLSKKVVFLDRDGVINKKPTKADYVKKWQEFEFLPGAIEALRLLNQNNYQVYIITNQPGIARGMMTKQELDLIHQKMKQELIKDGAKINGIYSCLHGWDEKCECRKPKPGLLFQAAREHNLDLTKSVFIGDDERDFQAGLVAGCKTILVTPKKNLLEIVKNFT